MFALFLPLYNTHFVPQVPPQVKAQEVLLRAHCDINAKRYFVQPQCSLCTLKTSPHPVNYPHKCRILGACSRHGGTSVRRFKLSRATGGLKLFKPGAASRVSRK